MGQKTIAFPTNAGGNDWPDIFCQFQNEVLSSANELRNEAYAVLRKRGLSMDVRYFAEKVLDISTRMTKAGMEIAVSIINQSILFSTCK